MANCGLERSLTELVRTRASQINGCAFCLHMHTPGCAETHGEAARENEVRDSTGPVSAIAGQLPRIEGVHRLQDVEGEDRERRFRLHLR